MESIYDLGLEKYLEKDRKCFQIIKENIDELNQNKTFDETKRKNNYKQSWNTARVWEKTFTVLTKDIYLKYKIY